MTIQFLTFKQTDLARLAASEALADCELEILRRALADGADIKVGVTVTDGDRHTTILVNGAEAVTYMSC